MARTLTHTRCASLICLLLLLAPPLWAEEAALNNITLSNTSENLVVYLQLEGAFTDKIHRAILSGMPTTFEFVLRLDQVRTLWLDDTIADIHVAHSVKYDNLKKEFTVRRSWKGNEPEVTASFEEAQALMNRIEGLKIMPLDRMEKAARYQLRAKAEVSKRTLPFNLHNILFFVSLWDVETDWYVIDFTY
jgi:hypothetical protein